MLFFTKLHIDKILDISSAVLIILIFYLVLSKYVLFKLLHIY